MKKIRQKSIDEAVEHQLPFAHEEGVPEGEDVAQVLITR